MKISRCGSGASVVSRLNCRISLALAAHGVVAKTCPGPGMRCVLRLALHTDGGAIYRQLRRDTALERAGKIRVLATSAAQKSAFFPKATSFGELGLRNLVQREWFGVFARAGASVASVNAIADEVRQMLAQADVRDSWNQLGLIALSSTPAELRSALRRDYDFWGPIITQSGFTPEI